LYGKIWCQSPKKHNLKIEKKFYSVFSKKHQKDTYKLEMSSVSTPLDNLLQLVRHTVHRVAQKRNLEVLPAFVVFFGMEGLRVLHRPNYFRPFSFIFSWSF
jgi:hypothetical protein